MGMERLSPCTLCGRGPPRRERTRLEGSQRRERRGGWGGKGALQCVVLSVLQHLRPRLFSLTSLTDLESSLPRGGGRRPWHFRFWLHLTSVILAQDRLSTPQSSIEAFAGLARKREGHGNERMCRERGHEVSLVNTAMVCHVWPGRLISHLDRDAASFSPQLLDVTLCDAGVAFQVQRFERRIERAPRRQHAPEPAQPRRS